MGDPRHRIQLTTLDLIAATMDEPRRPLDWAIVIHIPNPPPPEALERGARSARLTYPTSSAVLGNGAWIPGAAPDPLQEEWCAHDALRQRIERFLATPWSIRERVPISQALFRTERAGILVTRVHHAVADLVGATLWLTHQLQVALGALHAVSESPGYTPPRLRTHPSLQRKSMYSYRGPSDGLRVETGGRSGARQLATMTFDPASLREKVSRLGGFTFNDALATCALETYRRWNQRAAPREPRRIGLWMPTNIRETPLEGFGNGSTRIRIYNRYDDTGALHEKSRIVRAQIEWSREHGEWALPPMGWLHRIPLPIARQLLHAYLHRPWVDMGTGPFSHAERSPLDELPVGLISEVELMGTLDQRHPFGIFAITHHGQTHFSFVHDPARLSEGDATALRADFIGMLGGFS